MDPDHRVSPGAESIEAAREVWLLKLESGCSIIWSRKLLSGCLISLMMLLLRPYGPGLLLSDERQQRVDVLCRADAVELSNKKQLAADLVAWNKYVFPSPIFNRRIRVPSWLRVKGTRYSIGLFQRRSFWICEGVGDHSMDASQPP